MPSSQHTAVNLTSAYSSGNWNHLLFLQIKDSFSQMKSAHQTVINLPPLGLMPQALPPSAGAPTGDIVSDLSTHPYYAMGQRRWQEIYCQPLLLNSQLISELIIHLPYDAASSRGAISLGKTAWEEEIIMEKKISTHESAGVLLKKNLRVFMYDSVRVWCPCVCHSLRMEVRGDFFPTTWGLRIKFSHQRASKCLSHWAISLPQNTPFNCSGKNI